MPEKISVLIIDDHAVLRSGLRLLLEVQDEFEVLGKPASGEEALERIRALSPVITMERVMPGMAEIKRMALTYRSYLRSVCCLPLFSVCHHTAYCCTSRGCISIYQSNPIWRLGS